MILLIPIVSFAPLQLNRKLKFSLIVISFVLAVLGGWAQQYMPLTRTISILVLLSLLVTYVIGKRIVHQPHQESDGNSIPLEAGLVNRDSAWLEREDSPSPQDSQNPLATPSAIHEDKEEPIGIIDDTLPELEDLVILEELQGKYPLIEETSSKLETSEEVLLKKRRLFEILGDPVDDQSLENVDDDEELSTGTERFYNKR